VEPEARQGVVALVLAYLSIQKGRPDRTAFFYKAGKKMLDSAVCAWYKGVTN
jgi:hypothetical protein